jgi:Deltex C-terminal domain
MSPKDLIYHTSNSIHMSGRVHLVTWASIPHKTSKSGGPEHHGFPDPDFFDVCNQELDALHVPAAVDLD